MKAKNKNRLLRFLKILVMKFFSLGKLTLR
jgi:hypothetical protein